MRRSSVKLVLASSLPLALSACSAPEETYTVSKRTNYTSVQACVDDKVAVDVCSDAYMQALADHRRIAPTYGDKAACEADFVPDYCQVTSDGRYMPRLGGFELAVSGEVSQSQVDAARAQIENSGQGGSGGSNVNGLLTGLLLGQVLSGGNRQYYSQPVYQYRDSRGDYRNSTLGQQVDQGKRFERSDQAQSSGTGSYTYSGGSSNRNYTSKSSTRSSVSSSTSRGGFGSQATARSGWGGKSSGGFSFGG
ncbi:DUF1190 domain-containing protein [Pseudomonas entomophila]|uniref:DUF1190 domain-containing protein n=1 Tax=Pseudomonas entomophila TaxID=312306 RepID=UPI001EFFC23D|nr:DUF1190 domain-containing protein [Pseudomonas entomophila]MCG8296445.1 DUF1190 domain-containing protein [Pseudomonas entomophila]